MSISPKLEERILHAMGDREMQQEMIDAVNAAVNAAGTVTSITAGTGLSGGVITGAGTVALANTAVTPGAYGSATQSPQITVDAQGRITAAAPVTISGVAPGGAASGDLSGTYPAPSVATVGTSSAANIHAAELLANASTNLNTASTIVRRDASGNFSAGLISSAVSLPASTVSAGSAPLKVAAGTLMTTPEAGALEYSGTVFYLTDAAGDRARINRSYVQLLPSAITVPASLTPYQNAFDYDLDVIVTGGTVTLIEFSRDGVSWFSLSMTAGMLRLSPGDRVRITYSVAPTMTGVPR